MQIHKLLFILGLQSIVSVQCGLISTQSLNLDAFVDRVSFCPEGSTTLQGTTVTTVSDCVCLPGHYPSNNRCILCPAHTYKSATDNSTCLDCPSDTVSLPGSSAKSMCLCSAGFGHSTSVVTYQLEFVSGQYALDAELSPLLTIYRGIPTTIKWPSSSHPVYITAVNQWQGELYEQVQIEQDLQQTTITVPVGPDTVVLYYYCNIHQGMGVNPLLILSPPNDYSAGICVACPQSKFKSYHDNSICPDCPLHSNTTNTGSDDINDCLCDRGYYGAMSGPLLFQHSIDWADVQCTACPAGKFKDFTGYTDNGLTDASCSTCNSFSTSQEASVSNAACECLPAYTGPNGGPCATCNAGKYKAITGPQTCTSCHANSSSASGSSNANACICNAGYSGSGECNPCDIDTYKSQSGNEACTACPENTVSASGSILVNDCACGPGFHGANTACTPCPSDYYCTGASNLTPCPANSSSPLYSFQEEDCVCLGGFEKETSL